MVRLASIEFTKLKNVRDGTRLTFPEAGAVLLGKNGTGKTTLLQYIVALCTANPSAFISDEPFDVSATFSFAAGARTRLRLQGEPTSVAAMPIKDSPQVARYLSPSESIKLEYYIILSSQQENYRIAVSDNRAELYRNDQSLCTPFPIDLSQSQLASCVWRLANLVDQPEMHSLVSELADLGDMLCRYDDGLDYFHILTDEHSSYVSFDIIVSDESSETPSKADDRRFVQRIPAGLATALMRGPNVNLETEYLFAKYSHVEFLNTFVELSNFSGATIVIPIDARRATDYGILYKFRTLKFSFELGSERISHTKLSFGQKRLLSYLYYLECNTEIGVADELVNGMHHEWIEHCLVTACENRQMFYTSQNPLLLDFLEFESEPEISERFVTCKWNDQDGFVWENLDPRIGQEFYRLYKAGLQHVSDILRTKGWW